MVTRYDMHTYEFTDHAFGMMEPCEYGDYVTFEDYQDLEDKLVDAEVELKLLKDKITDLFREM